MLVFSCGGWVVFLIKWAAGGDDNNIIIFELFSVYANMGRCVRWGWGWVFFWTFDFGWKTGFSTNSWNECTFLSARGLNKRIIPHMVDDGGHTRSSAAAAPLLFFFWSKFFSFTNPPFDHGSHLYRCITCIAPWQSLSCCETYLNNCAWLNKSNKCCNNNQTCPKTITSIHLHYHLVSTSHATMLSFLTSLSCSIDLAKSDFSQHTFHQQWWKSTFYPLGDHFTGWADWTQSYI